MQEEHNGDAINVSYLPPEICERVIDFVAADTTRSRTLLACALTCRTWLPRSRHHIFHSIQLTSFVGYDRLDAVLRSNSIIASCIRVLNFEIGILGVCLGDYGRVLPVSLLARLPFLQSVRYYSAVTAQTPHLRTQIANLPRINTVTAFSVHVCVFQKLSDMIMLVAAFPNLQILHLFEVFFVHRDFSCLDNERFGIRIPLTSFHMESLQEAPALLGWLTQTSSLASLNTLSVGLDRSEHVAELDQFLHNCGESLRHLSFRSRSMAENKYDGLDLAYNINLRSLSFRIVFLKDLELLPELLSTSASKQISRITIRLLPRSNPLPIQDVLRNFESVDCSSFDVLLASPQFSGLRTVVFDFACSLRLVEMQPVMMHHFPQLYARGLIVVNRQIV